MGVVLGVFGGLHFPLGLDSETRHVSESPPPRASKTLEVLPRVSAAPFRRASSFPKDSSSNNSRVVPWRKKMHGASYRVHQGPATWPPAPWLHMCGPLWLPPVGDLWGPPGAPLRSPPAGRVNVTTCGGIPSSPQFPTQPNLVRFLASDLCLVSLRGARGGSIRPAFCRGAAR